MRKRENLKIRIDIEMKEYTKYVARKLGLNITEFVRMVVGERIHIMKQSLTEQEINYVESNIKVANLKQDIEILDMEQEWRTEAKAKNEQTG